jgi:hypothetical protein
VTDAPSSLGHIVANINYVKIGASHIAGEIGGADHDQIDTDVQRNVAGEVAARQWNARTRKRK